MVNVALTRSFGTSVVNEARIAYARLYEITNEPIGGVGVPLSSLGFASGPGSLGIVPSVPTFGG